MITIKKSPKPVPCLIRVIAAVAVVILAILIGVLA
jgi:hypothetical protein